MSTVVTISPHNGLALIEDTPHSLTDGTRRYPVIKGIPYLRSNREELCARVLEAADSGAQHAALILLLQDQDDWARTPPPSFAALETMLQHPCSLREAMRLLNFGPVADYFAYRWSDPTFLSGLALLQAHLPAQATLLELGCGIGHYLRECELRGIEAYGTDVVFAKLWLARRYVAPSTPLVCFDAGGPFPFPESFVDAAFCHDAFYFMPNKRHIASELRRVVRSEGTILIGHSHNAAADNLSAGQPLTLEEYAALFPGSIVYDDEELTRSWIEERHPHPGANAQAAALSFALGKQSGQVDFRSPLLKARLRLNPLFKPESSAPEWPSDRYRQEYAALSRYLDLETAPVAPTPELIRRRVFLSLPDQW